MATSYTPIDTKELMKHIISRKIQIIYGKRIMYIKNTGCKLIGGQIYWEFTISKTKFSITINDLFRIINNPLFPPGCYLYSVANAWKNSYYLFGLHL